MAGRYQLVRGMRDILPDDADRWREVEAVVLDVLRRYGYREIRLPHIEATELFSRGVGEGTDLVEKEMYTFADRKGKSLSLRPEGTAGCARACIEAGLLHGGRQRLQRRRKLYYHGSMFRYERPQKGRTREHTQIGAEAFGFPGPDIDAELLAMLARIFRELGLAGDVALEINSLGDAAARERYRRALVDYLAPRADALDADSRRRLESNPLRILDSKVPATRELLADAPRLADHCDAASDVHFDALRRLLDRAGVGYRVNAHLVRGLDYYTRTVFEWVTDALGAQNAVCSGGRYDGLAERLGGRATPGLGFGMGLDRIVLLHAARHERRYRQADVYVAVAGERHAAYAAGVAEHLREHTALRIVQHLAGAGASLGSQIKEADASGARWAVIVGDDEAAAGNASLKPLRESAPQEALALDALAARLADA